MEDSKEGRATALFSAIATRSYAILAFLLPLAVFANSLAREPGSWDTAELQGVPYILGIAHPTGFPLYTLLGYAFSHVVAVDTVAYRMNLLAALCVSAACVAAYLTAREFEIPKPLALIGSVWFAVANIVWMHAIRAEAHDLALALCAFTILYAIRWQRAGRGADFRAGAVLFGLTLATHPIAIWLVPGLLACGLLAVRKPRREEFLFAASSLAGALALYAYLPLRSWYLTSHGLDPAAALDGANSLFWNYNDPATWRGFLAEVTGSQFGAGGSVLSAWNPARFQEYLWSWVTLLNGAYGIFAVILALFGLQRLWKRNWKICLTLLIACLGALPFSYAYSIEGDADRYRLLSAWAVPILIGGVAAAVNAEASRIRTIVIGAVMLLCGAQTLANNRWQFGSGTNEGGRPLITEAALHVPRASIVVTPWMDATSLAYGAYVDGSFAGRTVVAAWPGDSDSPYVRWLKIAPVYLIGPPNQTAPGVSLRPFASLDASHEVYKLCAGSRRC